MEEYVATFFSHFGAMAFKKKCDQEGFAAKIMPVPRNLSSSCGTCVKYRTPDAPVPGEHLQEIEQIVQITGDDQYETVYKAENI